jgi:hypothetical protein
MWLQQLHRHPVPVHAPLFADLKLADFKTHNPVGANIKLTLTKPSGAWPLKVLFWATDARANGCEAAESNLRGAEYAYGLYDNMGVAEPRGKTLELSFRCPVPYISQTDCEHEAMLWCRHLHYVGVRGAGESLASTTDIQAVTVLPGHYEDKASGIVCDCEPIQTACNKTDYSMYVDLATFQSLVSNYGAVGISALNGSLIHKLDTAIDYRQSVPAIARQFDALIADKKATARTPVVVYCASATCPAASKLIEKLLAHGICNIFYFKGGVEAAKVQKDQYTPALLAMKDHDGQSTRARRVSKARKNKI